MTLADEDTNSIRTDNAKRAFQGNVATQVTQPGGQLWNQAMQLIWPDDQILNQFATNQKMHILKKYKTHFKKYCKSDVQITFSQKTYSSWDAIPWVRCASGNV